MSYYYEYMRLYETVTKLEGGCFLIIDVIIAGTAS